MQYLPDTEWAALYVKEAQSYLGTNLSSFTLELQNMNISLQTQLQEMIHIAGLQVCVMACKFCVCVNVYVHAYMSANEKERRVCKKTSHNGENDICF